ncbi:MAG: hypothetical protein ACOYYU_20935 [Chloroflexota bacterium]
MKNLRGTWAKIAVLLSISLGLFWFSEQFSPTTIFEPQSTGWMLWMSYTKDLIQPFAFYFFICLFERWLGTWQKRVLVSFAIPTLMEFGQDLYYRVAASHYVGAFDPMDIVMYVVSVGLAVLTEQKVFARYFKFW